MAVTTTPVLPQAVNLGLQRFVEATDVAGTYKTAFTAGFNGSKVTGIIVTTDDGSATHVITFAIARSAARYTVGALTTAVSSGTSGAAAHKNGLDPTLFPAVPVDNDGQPYLLLKSGDTLDATFATALTAGKIIYVQVIGADF